MKRIGRKGKLLLFLVIFLLTTPLIVFYSLEGLGVFDTRSKAAFDWDKCPYSKADLSRDSKVGIEDFEIWLREFRLFKKDPSTVKEMADLDNNGRIGISDFSIWLSLWREFKDCKGNVLRCSPWCYEATRLVNFEEYGSLYRCSDTATDLPEMENCWMLGYNPSSGTLSNGEQLSFLRLELQEDSMCSFSGGQEEVCSYESLENYYQEHFGSVYVSVDGYHEQGSAIRVSSMEITGETDEPVEKDCTNADEIVNVGVGEIFSLSLRFGSQLPYLPYPPVYDNDILRLVSENDSSAGLVERIYKFEAMRATHYTCTLIELGLSHIDDGTDKTGEKTVAVFINEVIIDPDPVTAEAYCNEIPGAEWLSTYEECVLQGVTNPQQYASECVELGGVYDDCASACRHVYREDVQCLDVCVPLCSFDPNYQNPDGPSLM